MYDPFVSNKTFESNPDDKHYRFSGWRSYAQNRPRGCHATGLGHLPPHLQFPAIKFNDIGRKCFAWALRQAWVEIREAARLTALPSAVKAERAKVLEDSIARADFIESGLQWKATVVACRDEIRALRA